MVRTPMVVRVWRLALGPPGGAGPEWQWRQPAWEGCRVPSAPLPGLTRANHSDASGVGVSATQPLTPRVCNSSRTRSHRSSCAAEEPQAATHFEQQAVRWLEADTRRESLESERCDGFEECLLTTRIACEASAARGPAPARS